jgi:hypothetical protein
MVVIFTTYEGNKKGVQNFDQQACRNDATWESKLIWENNINMDLG